MNPITVAKRDLAVVAAEIDALQSKYGFLKGLGTGWMASHYGLSDAKWDAIHATHTELRRRYMALKKEIARLRKVASPRGRITLRAHQ